MATIQGVIFPNRQAFDGIETAVYNFFKAKFPENIATKWSEGIDSNDSNEVLMLIDERVMDFNWNPHAIVDIDTNDTKWFIQDEI